MGCSQRLAEARKYRDQEKFEEAIFDALQSGGLTSSGICSAIKYEGAALTVRLEAMVHARKLTRRRFGRGAMTYFLGIRDYAHGHSLFETLMPRPEQEIVGRVVRFEA